ncbi:hypothetical protein RRG08_059485 [Elysia crispata]|uniref:Uncharacterized protein n=1 Tax=Elysia crispata TaxID=231223 RepID=A0AAE1DS81_9GAST|nr:hypothetical protein RRG08_059485 [Elysia crispata]
MSWLYQPVDSVKSLLPLYRSLSHSTVPSPTLPFLLPLYRPFSHSTVPYLILPFLLSLYGSFFHFTVPSPTLPSLLPLYRSLSHSTVPSLTLRARDLLPAVWIQCPEPHEQARSIPRLTGRAQVVERTGDSKFKSTVGWGRRSSPMMFGREGIHLMVIDTNGQ